MSLAGIDVDPVTWVRNKLGTDDLWNYGNAANLLNNELLNGIEDNFHTFDVKIKLKLLLSFLQIPRRNIEELSDELFRIVHLAESDGDDWVKVVASMLREYPGTARVNTDLSDHSSTFQQIIEDIGIAVEHSSTNGPLPMECPYLNRTALNHLVGQQQGPAKHFTLRRKPKSAALRAQLTQRASELASHKKSLVAAGGSSFHGSQRRPSGPSARESVKGLTSPAKSTPSSRITPLLPTVRSSLRTPTAALKKTKLLDITEQPIAGRDSKKKRKAQESEAAVADSKVSKVSEQQQQGNSLQPPDDGKEDANGPVKEPEEETKEHANEKEESSNEPQSPHAPIATPSYALLPGSTQQPSYAPATSSTQGEERSGALRIDPNATAATKNLQRELQIRARQQQLLQQQQQQQQLTQQQLQQQKNTEPVIDNSGQFRPLTSAATELSQSLRNEQLSRPEVSSPALNPFTSAGGHLKHYRIQGASATPSLTNPSQPAVQPQSLPQSAAVRSTLAGKKGLSLTREQMLAAQEMFRSANKVTRSEKALIIGFMAGLRENPFPQQGPIITIKLSEENTNVPQADGSTQMVLVEMLFEMNYETGHWRRLKRTRVLAQSVGDDSASSQY